MIRHFLDLTDVTGEELTDLLREASRLKRL